MPSPPAKLPAVLAQLVNRTLLATFTLRPPPASLADSMAVHQQVCQAIHGQGKLVHYRQAICPVTKVRLEKLQILVEDLNAHPDRVDLVHRGELLHKDLSPVEHALASFLTGERLVLESATRNPDRILALKYLDLST